MRQPPPIRKPSYSTYLRMYEEKRQALAKKGYDMDERMYSEREFFESYEAVKNDMLEKGKKPSNITRQLVTNQAYAVSYKEATAIYHAYKNIGEPHKLLDIQTGRISGDNLYKVSSERYNQLKKEGKTSKEAQIIISTEIWGSPD